MEQVVSDTVQGEAREFQLRTRCVALHGGGGVCVCVVCVRVRR